MLQALLDIAKHLLVITYKKLWLHLLWCAILFSFSFRHFVSFEVCVCFYVVFVILDFRGVWLELRIKGALLKWPYRNRSQNKP